MSDSAFDWLENDSPTQRSRSEGFGVSELLGLSDPLRELALEITRREPISLIELVQSLGRDPVELEVQVSQLVMQGWVEVEENSSGDWVYRTRIVNSPARLLPPGIWQVIDDQWQVPLLRLFPEAIREELSQCFRLDEYHANKVLYSAGSWQDRMYVVASGRVHLLGESEEGEPFVVRRVKPGGLFGEMAILLGERAAHTALVAEGGQIWSMSKGDLEDLLLRYPVVGLEVRRELARQFHTASWVTAKQEHNPVLVVGQGAADLARCVADESGDRVVLVDLIGGAVVPEGSLTVVDGLGMRSPDMAQTVRERAARGEWVVVAALPEMTNHLMRVAQVAAVVVDLTGGACSWLYSTDATCWTVSTVNSVVLGRLARRLCGRLLGLALSGGMARSIAHIGVLDVLNQAGVAVDAIAACGYAAIWAVLYAAGWSPERIIGAVTERVAVLRPFGARFGLRDASRTGLYDLQPVRAWLQETVGALDLGDLGVPCCLVVGDARTGEVVPIRDGSAFAPLSACVATPGLVTSVDQNGRLLHDALLRNPLPVGELEQDAVGFVLASTSIPLPEDRPSGDGRSGFVDCLLETCSAAAYERSVRGMERADLVVRCETGEYLDSSFENAALLIECGREAARRALPRLNDLLRQEGEARWVQ